MTISAAAYLDPNEIITVTFRLIGAYPAEQDVDLSKDPYMPEYVTWIPTTEYTIAIDATMYDLFTMAMEDAGLTSIGAEDDYVETIYAPEVLTGYDLSEFTNGQNSGWMYTVNGKTAGVGLTNYKFSSDEEIVATRTAEVVWHYINDWIYEQSDYFGTSGNASTWDKWLEAPDVAPTAVPATSIELSETDVSLTENETVTLTATVLPSYALVTWTSSDEDVATVDASGKVTAVSEGTATITVSSVAGEESASCDVTVTAPEVPVTGVTLNKDEITMVENETVTLTATVSPDNATDPTVTWTSSDEDVATVIDGVVTGVSAGTATITAKAGTVSATCEVTVTEEEKPEADVTFIGGDDENPIAEVTSVVETIVDANDKETKVATITVDSTWINNEGEVEDTPCVVVVKNSDGSYERLEAKPNKDGSYSFVKEGYTEDMEFFVVVKGDANLDGVFDGSDITRAKAAYLKKTTLSELGAIAADLNGDGLDGSDITKAKAAYLKKTSIDW